MLCYVILHAKFYLDPSNSLAAIHQRHRQTGHTDSFIIGRPKMIETHW